MNLWVLDTDFEQLLYVDAYESLLWTERFNEYGEFELSSSFNASLYSACKTGNYVYNSDSEYLMIITDVEITSDADDGKLLVVSGYSIEYYLTRRIIWDPVSYDGDFQNAIKDILTKAFINPDDTNRKVDNFVFDTCSDTAVTDLTIDNEYTGDNVYTVIKELCQDERIGFKLIPDYTDKTLHFSLYAGTDRSYEQSDAPYVVFSPYFDNLISSEYSVSAFGACTISLVAGAGEGTSRKRVEYGNSSQKALNRSELYVDARDISDEDEDSNEIPWSKYKVLLMRRGLKELRDYQSTTTYTGETDPKIMFVYGKDFFMGDVVQLVNEFGYEGRSRITELIISISPSKQTVMPTFSAA